MRFGTFFRLIFILACLLCPWIVVFFTHDWDYIGLISLYLFIPLVFVWEMACEDCDGCFMSGYCSKTKKGNFIKTILQFFGYNKDKLDNINNYEKTLNHYWNIYKFIIKEYNKS
jgi:hypothetical protein